MTHKHSDQLGPKRDKSGQKRSDHEWYEPEIMYQYWAAAGGKVREAIRLAADAGEDRVPSKRDTWADYALRYKFAERFEEEERKQWEEFHAQRSENQQRVLDKMAHAFEELGDAFYKTIMRDIAALHSHDPQALKQAQMRLDKLFGSIDSVDRFFRMYLRSRDLPERLTQPTMKDSPNEIDSEELQEEDNWASSAEEARRETEDE